MLNVPQSEAYELGETPPGYRRRWLPDETCRLATPDEHRDRKCRRPYCDGAPVMAMLRSRGHWWLYCRNHMYGRRIVNGVVEFPRLVPDV